MNGERIMTGLSTFVAIWSIFLLCETEAVYYDATKYCQVVPGGTKLPDLTSCSAYYQCYYSGDTKVSCFNGAYFDKQAQMCRPASTVKCYIDTPPCERSSASLVPDPQNCHSYIMCKNNIDVGRKTCPDGQIFNATSQSCTKGTCYIVDANEVANICNVLPDEQLFGDFEQCNKWHQCRNGKLISGTCEDNKVFNIEKGACVINDKYDKSCFRFRKQQECDFPGEFRNDPHVCSIYSYCWGKYEDGFTCGGHDYFEASTGLCVDRQMATPSTACNRCEYATTQWVNAVDPHCSKYLLCQYGVPVMEGSCGAERYFDEQRQACIVGQKNLEEYRKRNGACRVPKNKTD